MFVKNIAHKTIWLWLLLFPLFTPAQTLRLTQLTAHDGLPIDNVYAAAQDDDGFIWFGTDFGISRYDGNRFLHYYRKNGMANKAVTDIVYAGGDSLIFFSYPLTIQAIHKDGHINTLVDSAGFALHQLTKHNRQFYCYTRSSNKYGILEDGKYAICKADSVFGKGTIINSIASIAGKGVAFCTNKGLFIKNGPQLMHLLPGRNVQFTVYTNHKTLLAVADGKLLRSDEAFAFRELPFYFPPAFTVYHAAEEKSGNVWFRGIDKGVYRLTQNGLDEMSARIGVENRAVHEFFPDTDGNLWFCTDGAGVLLKKNSAFLNYETGDGLASNKVLQLLKQNDELLIGTSNGLSVLKDSVIHSIHLPRSGIGLQYVSQLFPVGNGVTGICVANTFSFIDNPGKNESLVKDQKIDQHLLRAFKPAFAWQQDSINSWMVSSSILIHIQKGMEKSEIFNLAAYKVRKGYSMIAYENKLWLGTDAGIIFIDKDNISRKDSIDKMKIGQVFKFLTDNKKQLWIATEIGLFRYKKGQFTSVETGPGAGSKYCTSITEDNEGKIWVSTWDGIFVFNGNKKEYYNTNDGLPSKTVNCILFDPVDRQLYIGTDNGMAVLKKTFFLNRDKSRRIFISCNITGNEQQVSDNSSLSPTENNLSFYFSFPYYQDRNKVNYEYKLDDGSWTSTTSQTININDLSAGKYHLFVRAKVYDEQISNGETVFTFTIETPFYKSWWFWLIVVIVSQGIIFGIIDHFNKKAKEKKLAVQSQQVEYASLKQQAFTLLMNPHFIFNALNSVQYYVNRQDRQSANKYLSDFATLIRRSFDASQKSFVSLEEELETIRLYLQLEKMRFTDKFEYQINQSKEAAEEDWMLPSMMLQPFLENAVLHGLTQLEEKGMLTIDVTVDNNCLHIVITDNGIGIEKSKALRSGTKHKSKGMQLIIERLELLSKLGKEPITLTITAADPAAINPGTKITLIIPQEVYNVYQQQRNPA